MSTIASIRVDTWGSKFVVVGEFGSFSELRREFASYGDAIEEMMRMAKREELRYATGAGGAVSRDADRNKL